MKTRSTQCDASVMIKVCHMLLAICSWILFIATFPLSLCVCVKVVQQYEKDVIMRLGRLQKSRGPGLILVLPCIESFHKVDVRSKIMDVPAQEVITKDSVTLSVDAVVYYHISNATASFTNVRNPKMSAGRLAQTTLTNIFGNKELEEVLSGKERISHEMHALLDEATEYWGIKVERVEIQDVSLPEELQRAMAAEAEAARDAKAKIIAAEGEIKAAKFLHDASRIIDESPHALQLKYLQTLSTVASGNESTILFPVPLDIECWSFGEDIKNE